MGESTILASQHRFLSYLADVRDDGHLAFDGGDGVQEHRLEDDAVGPARKIGNLGELIEKPGKQRRKGRKGGGEADVL